MSPVLSNDPVIAFDGICVLCHGFVRFMLRHDKSGRFRFASTESEAGQRLFAAAGQDLSDPASVILDWNGGLCTKSDAVLRAVALLGGPWRAATLLRVIPKSLRDWAYRAVATRRYRIFGKLDACPVPPPELSARFLR
jgi:predicted DCC family thiol-disulfide oxidoreductase YuxK